MRTPITHLSWPPQTGKEQAECGNTTPAAYEAYFFKGDSGPHTIGTELGRIGVGICYENQLADLPKPMYEASVDLVLMPHSAPTPSQSLSFRKPAVDIYNKTLEKIAQRLAVLLGVPVVMVNKSGRWQTTTSTTSPILEDGFNVSPVISHCRFRWQGQETTGRRGGRHSRGSYTGRGLDKTRTQPACHGRWAWKGPWLRN